MSLRQILEENGHIVDVSLVSAGEPVTIPGEYWGTYKDRRYQYFAPEVAVVRSWGDIKAKSAELVSAEHAYIERFKAVRGEMPIDLPDHLFWDEEACELLSSYVSTGAMPAQEEFILEQLGLTGAGQEKQQIIFDRLFHIWLIDDGRSPSNPKPEATTMPPGVGDRVVQRWAFDCELIYEVPSEWKRPFVMVGKRASLTTTIGLAFGGGGDQPWEGEGVDGSADAFERVLNHRNGEVYLWGLTYPIPRTTFYFISKGSSGVWESATKNEYDALCPEEKPEVDEGPFEFNVL